MKEIKYSKEELLKIKDFAEKQWSEMESRLNERVEEEYGSMGKDEWLEFRSEVKQFINSFGEKELFDYIVEWGEDNGIECEDLLYEFNWCNFEMEWGMP